jgi:transcriptional regulator with XRE-family HTH domain
MTLREWLLHKNMTAVAFGDLVGLDHSTIYRLVNGDRMPSLEVAAVVQFFTNGAVKPESFLRMTPEGYIRQWRSDAKKSANPARRARAADIPARPRPASTRKARRQERASA